MKRRKTYSREFKEEAIRLVKEEDGFTCIQVEKRSWDWKVELFPGG